MGTQYSLADSSTQAMGHRFLLILETYNLGSWTKVTGLSIKWDLADYRVGTSDEYFKYAGKPEYPELTLQRAVDATNSKMVQTWLNTVHKTGDASNSGRLSALNTAGDEVMGWDLEMVFPKEWSISDFDSSSGKVSIETLKLVHNGYLTETRTAGPGGGTGGGSLRGGGGGGAGKG